MEYWIAEAQDSLELSKKVEAALQDGWLPIGGVSAAPESDTTALWLMQAMTRQPKSDERGAAGLLPIEEKNTLFSAQSALVSSLSAMKALSESTPGRELSIVITQAETTLLWLNQYARVRRVDQE